LNVSVDIPYDSVINKPVSDSILAAQNMLFSLKVNIDAMQIQDELTSMKTFQIPGLLTFNNITRDVAVQYMPIVSGTEEMGNFNVYMSIQFNPRDFNLNVPDSSTRFVMKINNAKVNRL
jgi:polyisoprenoid-binding protein YceI